MGGLAARGRIETRLRRAAGDPPGECGRLASVAAARGDGDACPPDRGANGTERAKSGNVGESARGADGSLPPRS